MPRFASVNEDLILEVGGANDIVLERNGVEVDRRGAEGFGKVLQVVETHVTDTSTQAITAYVLAEIVGLDASITPHSANSRILIEVRWTGEGGVTTMYKALWGINRDSTPIGNADVAGSRKVGIATHSSNYVADVGATPENSNYSYIDSPATTSQITYKATVWLNNAMTLYNQRTATDTDLTYTCRFTSTIRLTEIGA